MDDAQGDPVLEIDQQQDPVSDSETKLPNSHSAALVMGFILLSVFSYCIYRIVKRKCCPETEMSTAVEDKKFRDAENTEDSVKKQHDAYLAIYGRKKNISSISGVISKNERTEISVPSSAQN